MTRQLKQALLLRTTLLKTLTAEKEKLYCLALNLWLRKRCTREEFDLTVNKFLSTTGIKLHTKFLSTLSKLSTGLMALPLKNNNGQVRKLNDINNLSTCKFIDKTIPCVAVCSARFFVCAWASGIISVNTNMGKLLHYALKYFLKDIIFTLISVKKSCKISANKFKHFKVQPNDACAKLPSGFIENGSISSNHLLLALQLNPNILKMGFSKYIELIVNGPLINNVAKLMPLSVH